MLTPKKAADFDYFEPFEMHLVRTQMRWVAVYYQVRLNVTVEEKRYET